ncbi:MAG: hypothetical protein RLZZ417_1559 [Bacteroidota bacterium]
MKQLFILPFLFPCFINMNAQTVIHEEMLGRPTNKSITLQIIFLEAAEVAIQYGLSPANYTNQSPWKIYQANEPAEIILDNLLANSTYYYRVIHRKPGENIILTRKQGQFVTQRPKGTPFSFVIQADPHLDEQSDSAVYKKCLQNQLEDNPDFMVDLGDVLMADKLKNASNIITRDTIAFRAKLMRDYYAIQSHAVPMFFVLGNHEGESGWSRNGTANNVAVWGTLERKKYFLNPSPDSFYSGDNTKHDFVDLRENYYAWEWGDAQFIVLDPYWYTNVKPDSLNGWRWTLGKTQYDWLKTTLESSKATFKFVFSHQLVGGDKNGRGGTEFAEFYEWGGKNLNKTPGFTQNRPNWYKPVRELLKENKVNIFFHGHDHFFGKQEKDCLIYQEVPQPSHPNFSNVNYAKEYGYFEGLILPNSGHLRINVSPDGVKVEYVKVYLPKNETANRKNKDIAATYYIPKNYCYDSISTGIPVLWNANYSDELVYPNPANESVTFSFSLRQVEKLTLKILDVNGKEVKNILNGNAVYPGNYQIEWNGQNDNGQLLPGGIYMYQIHNEKDIISTGKIILVR